MIRCFADTYYFLALLSHDDDGHRQVQEFTRSFRGTIVTTDWVLTEVGDAMCAPSGRARFVGLVQFLRTAKTTRVIRASPELFDYGLDHYSRRPDKVWSLTDCISFVVMRRMEIADALTADHHFEQAGFRVLFR